MWNSYCVPEVDRAGFFGVNEGYKFPHDPRSAGLTIQANGVETVQLNRKQNALDEDRNAVRAWNV